MFLQVCNADMKLLTIDSENFSQLNNSGFYYPLLLQKSVLKQVEIFSL